MPSLEDNSVSSYYPKEILSSSSQFYFNLLAIETFPFDTACEYFKTAFVGTYNE